MLHVCPQLLHFMSRIVGASLTIRLNGSFFRLFTSSLPHTEQGPDNRGFPIPPNHFVKSSIDRDFKVYVVQQGAGILDHRIWRTADLHY